MAKGLCGRALKKLRVRGKGASAACKSSSGFWARAVCLATGKDSGDEGGGKSTDPHRDTRVQTGEVSAPQAAG